MDLQGFTTIDEVGDEDEMCDKEVRTDSSKSFSPNTAAEEIDYLNKIILDIEKDIAVKDADPRSSRPLPCLNIETELLIQTEDSSILQCGDKSTMDCSNNLNSKISLAKTSVPYEVNSSHVGNEIQLESFSKENKHSLDNEGVISDTCPIIPLVSNENLLASVDIIDKATVEVKNNKEISESCVKNNLESTKKTFVLDSSERTCDNILTKNVSNGKLNINDSYMKKPAQEESDSKDALVIDVGQRLLGTNYCNLEEEEEVCATSENPSGTSSEVKNIPLLHNIKAEPKDKEMDEEVDFGDYFNDPAEEINFDEICNIKKEVDEDIYFTKDSFPTKELHPVSKFEPVEGENISFVPKVHFKVEPHKDYSKEQVTAAFLMAQSSLALVINMNMFNNLGKSFPTISLVKFENLTPSEVCFNDHDIIDKFFVRYGTSPKKWKKIFKRPKCKKIEKNRSYFGTYHEKTQKEIRNDLRSQEIKTLKERYREAMNRTLARSTQDDKHSKIDFFGFKSSPKSQPQKSKNKEDCIHHSEVPLNNSRPNDKLLSSNEKDKKKHLHTHISTKQKEFSPAKKHLNISTSEKHKEINSQKKQMNICSSEEQIEMGSLKEQVEIIPLKKLIELDFSKKQEISSSEKQMEMDYSEKQLLEVSPKKQMEIDSSKKQIEIGSSEKQRTDSMKIKFLSELSQTKSDPSKIDEKSLLYYKIKPCVVLLSREMFPKWNPNPFKAARLVKIDIPSHHLKRNKVSHSSKYLEVLKIDVDKKETMKKTKDYKTYRKSNKIKEKKDIEKQKQEKGTLGENLGPNLKKWKKTEHSQSSGLDSQQSFLCESKESSVSVSFEKENRQTNIEKRESIDLMGGEKRESFLNSNKERWREKSISSNSVSSRHSVVQDSDDNSFSSFIREGQEKCKKEQKKNDSRSTQREKLSSSNTSREKKSINCNSLGSRHSLNSDSEESIMSISIEKLKKKKSKDYKDPLEHKLSNESSSLNKGQEKQKERSLSPPHSNQSVLEDSLESTAAKFESEPKYQSDMHKEFTAKNDAIEHYQIESPVNREDKTIKLAPKLSSSVELKAQWIDHSQISDKVPLIVCKDGVQVVENTTSKDVQRDEAMLNDSKRSDDFNELLNNVSVQSKIKDFSFSSNEEEFSEFLLEKGSPFLQDSQTSEKVKREDKISANLEDRNGGKCSNDAIPCAASDQEIPSQHAKKLGGNKEELTIASENCRGKSNRDEQQKRELMDSSAFKAHSCEKEKSSESLSDTSLSVMCKGDVPQDNEKSGVTKLEDELQNKDKEKITLQITSQSKKKESQLLPESNDYKLGDLHSKLSQSNTSVAADKIDLKNKCKANYEHDKLDSKPKSHKNFTFNNCSIVLEDLYFSKLYRKKVKKDKKYWARIKDIKSSNSNMDREVVVFGSSKSVIEKELKHTEVKHQKEEKNSEVEDKKESNKSTMEKIKKDTVEPTKPEKKKRLTEVPLFGSSFKIPKKSNKEKLEGWPKSLIQRSISQFPSYYGQPDRKKSTFDYNRSSSRELQTSAKSSSYMKKYDNTHDAPKVFLNFNPDLMLKCKEKERREGSNYVLPFEKQLDRPSVPPELKLNDRSFRSDVRSFRPQAGELKVEYPPVCKSQAQGVTNRSIPKQFLPLVKENVSVGFGERKVEYPPVCKSKTQDVIGSNTSKQSLSLIKENASIRAETARVPPLSRLWKDNPKEKALSNYDEIKTRGTENDLSSSIKKDEDFDKFEDVTINDSPLDFQDAGSPQSITSSSHETHPLEFQIVTSDKIKRGAKGSSSPSTPSVCEQPLGLEKKPDNSLEFIKKIESLDKKGKLKLYIKYKELYNTAKKKFHNESGDIYKNLSKLKRYKELNMRRKLYYDLKWYLYEQKKQRYITKKIEKKMLRSVETAEMIKSLNEDEPYSPSASPVLSENSQGAKKVNSEEDPYSPSSSPVVPETQTVTDRSRAFISSDTKVDGSVYHEDQHNEQGDTSQNLKNETFENNNLLKNDSSGSEEIAVQKLISNQKSVEDIKEILSLLQNLHYKETIKRECSPSQKTALQKLKEIGIVLQNLQSKEMVESDLFAQETVLQKIKEIGVLLQTINCKEAVESNSLSTMETASQNNDTSLDPVLQTLKPQSVENDLYTNRANIQNLKANKEIPENNHAICKEAVEKDESDKEYMKDDIPSLSGSPILPEDVTNSFLTNRFQLNEVLQNFENTPQEPVPQNKIEGSKCTNSPSNIFIKETETASLTHSPALETSSGKVESDNLETKKMQMHNLEVPGSSLPNTKQSDEVMMKYFLGDTYKEDLLKCTGRNHSHSSTPTSKPRPVYDKCIVNPHHTSSSVINSSSLSNSLHFSHAISAPYLSQLALPFPGVQPVPAPCVYHPAPDKPPMINILGVVQEKVDDMKPTDIHRNDSFTKESSVTNLGISLATALLLPPPPPPSTPLQIKETCPEQPQTSVRNVTESYPCLSTHESAIPHKGKAFSSLISEFFANWEDPLENKATFSPSSSVSARHLQKEELEILFDNVGVKKDKSQYMDESLYGKTSLAQPLIEKVEGVPLVGLQLILEVQKEEDPSLESCSYICSLCSKKMSSATLIAHIKSVPHRLKYTECFSEELHEKFGKMEVKQWTASLVREFTLALQELEKKIGRQKIAVIQEKSMNTAVNHLKNKINVLLKKEIALPQPTTVSTVAPPKKDVAPLEANSKKTLPASAVDVGASPLQPNKTLLMKPASPKQQKRPAELTEKPGPKFTKSAQYKSREQERDYKDKDRDYRDKERDYKEKDHRDKNRDYRDKDYRDKLPPRDHDRDSRSKSRRKDSPHRRRSPSPRRFSPHKKSRTQSPPFRSDRNGSFGGRKDEPVMSAEERKLRDFRADEMRIKNEHFKQVDHYIKDPESHPRYKMEWERFWDRRYREIKQQGHNTDFYDFRAEWLNFWPSRLREICALEFKSRREEMLARYRIPDPDPPLKVLDYFSASDVMLKQEGFKKGSLEKRPEESSRPSSRDRFDILGKKDGSGNRYQSRREKSPSPWEKNVSSRDKAENAAKDPYEVGFSVVGTLKLLTELEDQLGSLAPASKTLLKKAIEMTEKGGKPIDLFEDNDNLVLLRLVNVKFNSLVASGILDVMTAAKTQRAIESTNWVMKEAEKFSQTKPNKRIASLGLDLNLISTATIGMDTVQIAQYIAEQLFNIGKSDVDESVLQDILIAVSENHGHYKLQSQTSSSMPPNTNSSYIPPNNASVTSMPSFAQQSQLGNLPSQQIIASQNQGDSRGSFPQNKQGNIMRPVNHSANEGTVPKNHNQGNLPRFPFIQQNEQRNAPKPQFFPPSHGCAGPRPVAAPQNNSHNLSGLFSVPALFPSGAQSATEVKKDVNQNSSDVNTDRSNEDKRTTALSLLQSAYDNEEESSKDKKDMDNLSLEELQGLLSNFRKLNTKEQQNLTDYLKRLEATDNKKVTKLRSMMHSSKPVMAQAKEQKMVSKTSSSTQSFRTSGNKAKQDDLYDPLSPSVYEEPYSSKRPPSFDNSKQGSDTLEKTKGYGAPIPGKDSMLSANTQEYYSSEKKAAPSFPPPFQGSPGAEYSSRMPDNFQRPPPFPGDYNENRSLNVRQPLLLDPNVDSGFSRPRPSLLPEPNMELGISSSRQPLLPKPTETEFPHARQTMPHERGFQHPRHSMPREPSRNYGYQNMQHEANRDFECSGPRQNKQEPRPGYPKSHPLPHEPKMDSNFSGPRQSLLQDPRMDSEFSRPRQPLLPEPNTDSRFSSSRQPLLMDSSRDQLHSGPRQPLLSEPRGNEARMQSPQSSVHSDPLNEPRYRGDGFRPNSRATLLSNPPKESGFFSDEFQTKPRNPVFPYESGEYSERYQSEDKCAFYSGQNNPPYSNSRKTLLPDPSNERGFSSDEYRFDRNSEDCQRSRDMKERIPFGSAAATSFSGNRFNEHDISTSNFNRTRPSMSQDFMRSESSLHDDERQTVFSEDLRSFSKSGAQFSAKHSNFPQSGENFSGSQRDALEPNPSNRFSSGFVSDSFRNFNPGSGNHPSPKNFDTFGSNSGPSGPQHSYFDSFRQGNLPTEEGPDQRSYQSAPQRFSRGRGRRGNRLGPR